MKHNIFFAIATAFVLTLFQSTAFAHGGHTAKLHVNPRWEECSFQIDPSLTQAAWHQFAQEAAMVVYFRSLTDAKPLGAWNFELSIVQWETGIDANDNAWNDTFVHPDSAHWLMEGGRLGFPGLMLRTGVSDNVDIAAYWTVRPGANYGVWGGQVQYSFVNDVENDWAASARLSVVSLYGPDDFDYAVTGLDILASKKYTLSDLISVSPYAGVSTYAARAHETTAAVNLEDEVVSGSQAMLGAVTQISVVKIGAEYNFATVNTLSFKVGVNF